MICFVSPMITMGVFGAIKCKVSTECSLSFYIVLCKTHILKYHNGSYINSYIKYNILDKCEFV